jgi:16S rRNA (adenine1518-N6/adenine1519-N6)-dimethyltransferase
MDGVRPKKHLGQHFLRDHNIAAKIAGSLTLHGGYHQLLEIGPGTGVLTQFLLQQEALETWVIEIDQESVAALQSKFPALFPRIIEGDFLTFTPPQEMVAPFAIIGNFPYNISSQILFRVLEWRDKVPEIVGMFQKEVAVRVASAPGSKDYGILSVLLQAWYDIELLFSVPPGVFQPPPKVQSAVIRLKRNNVQTLSCNEALFVKVVKAGFNQRRKTLRNSLKPLGLSCKEPDHLLLEKRAEALSVKDFVTLTNLYDPSL